MKRISLITLLAISISLLALGHLKLSSVNSAIDQQNKELIGGKERPAPIRQPRSILFSRSQAIPAYQTYGMNFSPYIDGQDPNLGTVISEDQLRARMEIIADHTIWVRSFGSTHGLEKTGMVAHSLGLKAAVGAWLSHDLAANNLEISNLITAANAGQVDLAIVGSEVLLRNDLDEDQLIGYMNQVRQQIPANIPVTTADAYGKLLEHTPVIANSDVVLANYYPYWGGTSIDISIATLHRQHQQVVAAAAGKSVIVSETGWPSAGNVICNAVPSPANASFYFLNFVSWARANNVPYFYFSAFDETWKANYEGPQGAHWGVWDKDGVLKPGMQDVFDGQTIPDNWTNAGVPGGPGNPNMAFSYVPPYGSSNHLFGQVLHVNTDDYKVAVYIYVNGWWTKPTFANPLTNIGLDGGWECNITTGGNDVSATQIVAYLVPADFIPPEMRGEQTLPPTLDEHSVAKTEIARSSSLPFIEGRVTDTNNHAVNCVTISLTGSQTATTHTIGNGNYSFLNLQPGGNYTITPSHPSYSFNPPSLTFNNLGGNQTGDFGAEPITYVIALDASPAAGGTVSGSGIFAAGSSRTVTATPNSDYTFTNWTENGSMVSSLASYTFTLNGNRNLVGNFAVNLPTAANGVVSGRITAVDGTPISGAVIQLTGSQSRKTITDANGDYRFDNVETAGFYTVTPSRANFNFSPTARFFSQLGGRTEAVFAGSFTGDALNPLDTAEYFVRQQYVDILGREPDEGGFNYWSDRILECASNQLCENVRRRDVAAAFYIEAEFQRTGAFIYGLYRSSFGRRPSYAEYSSDRQGIMAGGNLEGNEVALAEGFVQRAEFVGKYQANQTAESFIDALLQTVRQAAGVELGSERAALIDKYNEGSNLNQSRGWVLRAVSKAPTFKQAEYNAGFVLTEYFGYLRRDPDQGGYDFWLDVLNNRDPGNFRGMVCAFITSSEYQERFSLVSTRSNNDCANIDSLRIRDDLMNVIGLTFDAEIVTLRL